MKKIFLLGLSVLLFAACQENHYTQKSAEIDTFKKVLDDYRTQNWADYPTYYADTAKVMNNVTKEKAQTVAQAIEKNKEDAKLFTWVVEDEDIEMVKTDKGQTWVNYWGIWQGTLKSTKKVYQIPIHITARFVGGKIVTENGYWNNAEIVTDMMSPSTTSDTIATTAQPK